MSEPLLHSPEHTQNKPSIHLILGSHGEENIPTLVHDKAILTNLLQSHPTQSVIYYLEGIGNDPNVVHTTIQLMQQYYSPSDAYAAAIFNQRSARLPNALELAQSKRQMFAQIDPFIVASYSMLDEIYQLFPDRLRVTSEVFPFNPQLHARMEKLRDKSAQLVNRGIFNSAIQDFDEYAHLLAQETTEREQIMRHTLIEVASNPNTHVVARLGINHSSVAHNIDPKKWSVERDFIEKQEKEPFYFTPDSAYIRSLRLNLDYTPSHVDKLRALIGGMIFETLQFREDYPGEFTRPGSLRAKRMQVTHAILNHLRTESDLQEFERSVRKSSFGRALMEIITKNNIL